MFWFEALLHAHTRTRTHLQFEHSCEWLRVARHDSEEGFLSLRVGRRVGQRREAERRRVVVGVAHEHDDGDGRESGAAVRRRRDCGEQCRVVTELKCSYSTAQNHCTLQPINIKSNQHVAELKNSKRSRIFSNLDMYSLAWRLFLVLV